MLNSRLYFHLTAWCIYSTTVLQHMFPLGSGNDVSLHALSWV